jgi:hypothetical protein
VSRMHASYSKEILEQRPDTDEVFTRQVCEEGHSK